MKHSMIYTEKQLKYLHCLLINLDKHEYLTGKDLGLKPSTVEQAKFEYSPLGKIFDKRLSEEDKKERLLKKLKNIDDKNEMQIQVIKDQGEKQLQELKNIDKDKTLKTIDKISENNNKKKKDKANKFLSEFRKIDKTLENADHFVQKLIIKLNMTLIVFLFH